jgi:hypothetical protein
MLYVWKKAEDGLWYWMLVSSNGRPKAQNPIGFTRAHTALGAFRSLFGARARDLVPIYEPPPLPPTSYLVRGARRAPGFASLGALLQQGIR